MPQPRKNNYIKSLRMLKPSWTPEYRKAYFEWFLRAANYRGGASFQGFLRLIKKDAVASLSDKEKLALKPILEAKPAPASVAVKTRPFVKKYKLDELVPIVEKGLIGRD